MNGTTLSVYIAEYFQSGGWGDFDEASYVVIANTEEEALGFVLTEEKETQAKYWTISRIDTNAVGATLIARRSS